MKLISLTNKEKSVEKSQTTNVKNISASTCSCACNLDNSLNMTPAIATMGLHAVSYDQKDILVNPRHLLDRLDKGTIPELTSGSPFCMNFAADGFPRIDGQPWGLDKESPVSIYDPAEPWTLPRFGEVESDFGGWKDLPVLGFFMRLRPFDNELGSSAAKITVYQDDALEHVILSGTYEMKGQDACLFIPYFSPATTQRIQPINQTMPMEFQTIRFDARMSVRDQSYLVDTDYAVGNQMKANEQPSYQQSVMSTFTLTGHNIYAYVEPVTLSKEMMAICEDSLTNNPSAYLENILRALNGR